LISIHKSIVAVIIFRRAKARYVLFIFVEFEKVVFMGKGTSKMLGKTRLLTFDIPPVPLSFGNKIMLKTSRKNWREKVCVH